MNTRRGLTLLEVTVTSLLLAVLFAVSMRMVGATAARRRAAEDRRAAMREAANVMERLAVRPWNELTPEAVADLRLSNEAANALRGATLKIDVTDQPGEPQGKRIVVEVHWRDSAGKSLPPRRLTAWRYGGAQP